MGDKFDVKVGVHQGSVLRTLLFAIVLEALLRECRSTLPWEVLYADDLVITGERLEELDTRHAAWKHCMEGKGLRVNLTKTKMIVMKTTVQPLPQDSTHVEPFVRVLAQTPSFAIVALTACISAVVD